MISILIHSLGIAIAGFLIIGTHKGPKEADFLINSFITLLFIYSHIIPFYDPSMKLFLVLAYFVVTLGGIVGGVVGALLPKISIGVSLGAILWLFISTISLPVSKLGNSIIFSSGSILVISLTISITLSQKYLPLAREIRVALAAGLILSTSLDGFLNKGLFFTFYDLFRMRSSSLICTGSCELQLMIAIWIICAISTYVVQGYVSGTLSRWQTRSHRYQALSTHLSNSIDSKVQSNSADIIKQKTFSYPSIVSPNFFDLDDVNIPKVLDPYIQSVVPITQRLASRHGFQIGNSCNQWEHAVMLLSNETKVYDRPVIDAAIRIHARLFDNYRHWCDRMGTPPLLLLNKLDAIDYNSVAGSNYQQIDDSTDHLIYIEDIMLYLLIWGEASNLKHCPECLCFLFHKVMEDHINNLDGNSKYPGHFLDMVVTPMYDVIASAMKSGGDHVERKTYDDFNEFFWSPSCLKYSIYVDVFTEDFIEHGGIDNLQLSLGTHVSNAMRAATKTYCEKRSWLHPLFSMRRIFEWHAITFTLLTAWAFSSELQWTYAFTLQVGSFIFWEISFLSIVWTSLEVWTLYPQSAISGPSILGFLIRLLAGYLVFVYQSMYYHWSFRQINIDNKGQTLIDQGDALFWWWQYFWLSVVSLFFYFLESILCYYPKIVSWLLTWNNDVIQAILNICYPFSQLYVGKRVHVEQGYVTKYILFWISLILFKVWFGYRYIVHPVTIPSIELYDDYMNFQKISFVKTFGLMFVWWFPHFLVYLIDLSIWYSVWISAAGGLVSLIERQGAVRDSASFRSHFIRSPLAFAQRLLHDSSPVRQKSSHLSASTAALNELILQPKVSEEKSSPVMKAKPIRAASKAMSSADLQSLNFTAKNSNNKNDKKSGDKTFNEGMTEYLSDVRSQRWIIFSKVWNEIVSNLRAADHLSNFEREILSFSTSNELLLPVYLPIYQTAGCVSTSINLFKDSCSEYSSEAEPEKKIAVIEKFYESMDVTMIEAVSEAWELLTYILLKILGPSHKADIESLTNSLLTMAKTNDLFGNINPDSLPQILNYATNIVTFIKSSATKRKTNPIVTEAVIVAEEKSRKKPLATDKHINNTVFISNGNSKHSKPVSKMKKSVSAGFLPSLGADFSSEVNNKPTNKSKDVSRKFVMPEPIVQSTFVLNDTLRDKLRDEIRNILNQIKGALRGKARAGDLLGKITFILSFESGFFWNDIYASIQLDSLLVQKPETTDRVSKFLTIVNKLNNLLKLRQSDVELSSQEALRRLNFFINSLFMDIPISPSIKYCKEYTTMTPYYSEDVILSREDLESKNSDGVSTLLYLQTLYKRDWVNYLERCNIKDEQHVWSDQHIQSTRIWASLRAQTLYRTVDGIMTTEAALRLLAEIENMNKTDIDTYACMKFNYVVACQVYGHMKKTLDPKADDIEYLLKRHPNLRVAYIDNVRANREGDTHYYSVLIKYDQSVKEIYRIKLPGNPVLGEGKPENQNHAIVFTRGRYLQAIDMNQDAYFEEGLKMKNLLQEFDVSKCAILGFREHIFTGSVSSVANYMALQELSFVTLGQRVLNNPLCIRQHYGHPDLFDKFFVMTEGGMSKASKGINLSEDVFSGFNATIRGRLVSFKEYVNVGKGRDVGLQQTYKFEAKLSQGNAEQSISRDMSRICDRLDFYRLLSFYYGGIGHYVSNTMVMFTLVVVVYTMVGLAIYKEEGVNQRPILPEGIFQMVLAGMGVIQTFPLAVTLTVEKGMFRACSEIFYMMISGGPLYFIFHIQTKCFYFQQTLLAGNAIYRPTGRGFVIRHSPFDENYRFFATSHIYLGFELMMALILLAIYTESQQYGGLTWSLWMATVSFLLGPFWFNPVTFEWNKLSEDYTRWIQWMTETSGNGSEQSWDSWWKEENQFYKKLSFSWKCLMIVQKCFIWLFIAFGLFGWKFIDDNSEIERLFEVFGLFIIFFLGHWCISKLEKALSYGIRRFASLTLSGFVSGMVIYLFISHGVYVRYTLATYYVGSSIAFLNLLIFGVTGPIAHIYKIHDYLVGHTIFILLAFLTLLQFGYLQTWLLYHNALSAGVVMDDILKYARKSKERALDDETIISKLKEQVDQQAITIKLLTDKIIGNGEIELLEKTSLLGPTSVTKTSYGSTGESNPTGFAVPDFTAKSAADAISTTNRVMVNQNKHVTPETPVAATTTIPFTGIPNTYNTTFQNVISDTNMNVLTVDSPIKSKTSWDTTLTPSNKSIVDPSTIPPPTDFVFVQPTQFPVRHNDSSKNSSSKSSSTKSS